MSKLTSALKYVLTCTLAALPGCDDPDLADAPPVNAKITHEVGPLGEGEFVVTCDGPDEEVALLGELCGAAVDSSGFGKLEVDGGDGMGMFVGHGPHLMIYAQSPREWGDREEVAGELEYSAYVRLDDVVPGIVPILESWRGAEAVTSGEVRTEAASVEACSGDSWRGEGTFVWRSTTIHVRWQSGLPC